MTSYAIWSNKGGIGKSTLTFQIACTLAHMHPEKEVIVIDLSPQCDVSRMILGGGHHNGEIKILDLMQKQKRKTIYDYITMCINSVPTGFGWPNINNYIIDPNSIRDQNSEKLPNNLKMVCGDFDLERAVTLVDQMQQPPKRLGRAPSGPQYSVEILKRSFIRHAIEQIKGESESIVIVDSDPYFNVITTQMALLAADRWIATYSPNSQASQYAVTRSIEYLFETQSSLQATLQSEYNSYPKPWFDNQGNDLVCPTISIATPFMLITNSAGPFTSKKMGLKPYEQMQQLHETTHNEMKIKCRQELLNHNKSDFIYYEHMWDMRRLTLICDYNGIPLRSLKLGNKYPQPGANQKYPLYTTGGTPIQLGGYLSRLNQLCGYL